MESYKFTENKIDEDAMKIGLDVRPVLDIRAERTKLQEFAGWLTDKWPALFEKMVLGPGEFQVTKKLVFPGKGEAEVGTMTFTNRGLVFGFPKKLSALGGEEPQCQEDLNDVVIAAMEKFRDFWPLMKHVRCGKVRESVFDCGAEDAVGLIGSRFTKFEIPREGELFLKINRPREGYNRILEISNVRKQKLSEGGRIEILGSAVFVKADLNNQDMTNDLPKEKKQMILHAADLYFKEDVWDILNRGGE